MSFSPEIIEAEIRRYPPDSMMDYKVEPVKQRIADSWPNKMDDSCASEEWDWNPKYDLAMTTREMLTVLEQKKNKGIL